MLFQLFKRTLSIPTKESQPRLFKKVTLLDVWTPSEYRARHVPQAVNVPLSKIPAYNRSANEVYMIYQLGIRSKNTAKILAGKNHHVINVCGGASQ